MKKEKVVLSINDVSKSYGSIKALKDAKLKIYEGRVMALVGENGAGKSTIIKCITGITKMDTGLLQVFGKQKNFGSIKDSVKSGISVVHQELKLVNELSVSENIFLGRDITTYGLINATKRNILANEYLKLLNVTFSPKQLVKNLTIAQQQMVEIAKALSIGAKIIILDEPTDALSNRESNSLFNVIRNLKKQKISVLYVTHRMKEIKIICDDFTVFKDGKFVFSGEVKNFTIDQIVSKMIGRKITEQFPKKKDQSKRKKIIKIQNFSNKYVDGISFSVKKGEIIGLAGLIGSGRTEFAKTLIGFFSKTSGSITWNNEKIKIKNISQAIRKKIFYVSENRKLDGLNVNQSIRNNIIIANLDEWRNKFRLLSYSKIKKSVNDKIKELKIKATSQNDLVSSLSGGNQQKVLLCRALITKPKLLILDEPTRGVDVGARWEIYKLMNKICESGASIIMISSDLPEIIGMSDQVIVFHDGQITGKLGKKDISEQNIMNLATYEVRRVTSVQQKHFFQK